MKDFIRILRRFVPPYKKYMVSNIVFNILSAILNLFSFALIIPILNILFKLNDDVYSYKAWVFDPWTWESWKGTPELIKNNFFWFVSDLIEKERVSKGIAGREIMVNSGMGEDFDGDGEIDFDDYR